MCTVTYLPLKGGFILTSNRDEALVRKPALVPNVYDHNGVQLLFPKDGEAGGTWIATAADGRTVCLLNGAFVRHHHNPPYRKSRGLVVLDFFNLPDAKAFADSYDLTGIEPFTILVVEKGLLYELRWDGNQKFFTKLDEKKATIRCSVTLYPPEVIALREKWFGEWLAVHLQFKIEDILAFHLFAGEGEDHVKVRMRLSSIVQTLSTTCVHFENGELKMYYTDVLNRKNKDEEKFYFDCFSFKSEGQESDKGLWIGG
jgi:hypothetical protein